MLKIGLTGGIGCGKSTVSSMIMESGIPVIDADMISREIYQIYPELTKILFDKFGARFFDDYWVLKRKEFGDYIFQNPEERKKLEDTVIPYIIKEIFQRLNEYYKIGEKLCVVDAPTLMEHGLHQSMDFNIVVWVYKNVQIDRIMVRDGLTFNQAQLRIGAQMPLERKKELADFVINNNLKLSDTRKQVEVILDILKEYCK